MFYAPSYPFEKWKMVQKNEVSSGSLQWSSLIATICMFLVLPKAIYFVELTPHKLNKD